MTRGTEEQGPPLTGPVVLVTSPHAGHARKVEHLTGLLAAAGTRVGQHIAITELYEHRPEGSAWRDAGFTAAIAAGGDGTVGAVATHLAGSGLALGILPMGTANDVARSLDIPLDLEAACQVIAGGQTLSLDAGQVLPALTKPGALAVHDAATLPQGTDAPSPRGGAYFLHAMTLGLNVEFARLATSVTRRQRLRSLTYPASALEALAHYHPVRAKLRFPGHDGAPDDETREIACSVLTLLTVNTPVFGGPMNLRVPRVHPQDRLLDFVLIEAPEPARLRESIENLRDGLGQLIEDIFHRHDEPRDTTTTASERRGLSLPGVRHFQAHSLLIETDEPADLSMDGELRAHTPVLVRVAPEPVRVLVPTATLAAHESGPAATTTIGPIGNEPTTNGTNV